ncbi:MAG TPA: acyltransferase [Aliidongia sp.]|uniref:acyltransferase family protein n=1 Tax=Aliidongia sp. TaxID=1914230 RepID=UPI002DDD1E77|nr:acyltransferase [Aliidongia sp.]HEV2677866.1 acyltransferase [Aliidongia sp.]
MKAIEPPGSRGDVGHVFVALDGLRGVAALAVVVFHYSIHLGHPLLPNAYLAVDFFFALSGFVIAHAYERKLRAGQGFGNFMRKRIVRLYPLYWIGITLPLALIWLQAALLLPHPNRLRAIAAYVLALGFLPTPGAITPAAGSVFPLNDPAWSLSLEIAVNALYALGCAWLSDRRLVLVIALAATALAVAAFAHQGLAIGNDWPGYLGGWARVLWSFFAGILLYRLHLRRRRAVLPLWIGALLVLALAGLFAVADTGPLFGLANAFVLFPLIIWIGARVELAGAAARIASWLGLTSYALYITHLPILSLGLIVASLLHVDPAARFWPSLLIAVGGAVGAAWLLDRIYDVPVRRRLSRRGARPSEVGPLIAEDGSKAAVKE